jgi:carboxyl-terminal processing protease
MKKLSLLLIISLILLGSCKKEVDPANTEVTPEQARDSLYYIMKSFYYWYELMPAVQKEDYTNPYDLLEAMRYKERDKWSFVADYDEFINEVNGTFVGHGIRIGLDNSLKARIVQIYNNSPLYSQGVRRGWIIKTVNGYDIAAILIANDTEAYNTAFGPSTEGIVNNFVFQNPEGSEVPITSAKSTFTINSVILYDTVRLDKNGTKVAGHLVFESFILPSQEELLSAFTYFKAQNVTDLILDLRYNSGGYLNIAQQLASYIGGPSLAGTAFATLKYNNKWQSANVSYPFLSITKALSLSRLVVITSRLTASASEAVMNGLDPHITVVSVGDTTHGKPMGMNGWTCGKKYFFWPITFKLVNSANFGDYFDGLAPDKIAMDDVTRDFNDNEEGCLKEAILYLKTGSFSGKGSGSFWRSRTFPEKPSLINNTFVLEK